MPAFGELVEVNELGKCLLCPATRHRVEFVGEDAYSHGDGDALRIEVPSSAPILPIEPSARKGRVGQPGDRDVVEDVVAREALGFSLKNPCDQLVAARVVIKEVSRKTYGGIRNSVQRLRPEPHLEPVGDSLLIFMLQRLIGDLLLSRKTRWRRLPGKSRLVNLSWKDARHIGVNAEQLRSRLHTHGFSDNRAPISTLSHKFRVPKTLHQHDPGARDVSGIPPGCSRPARKAVARHRWDHDVECARWASAMGRGIGEWIDDLHLFDDRSRPSVRDNEWQRIFMFRTDVNEMNVQSIDLGNELR